MNSNNLTLGYWNVRGRGGVIRNLLNYCEVPYEHRVYTQREEWFTKDKYNLGLDFPNIPYIIDGDVKITETVALMNYVPVKGNKKELLGATDVDKIKVSEAISVLNDLRASIRNTCFTKGDFKQEIEDMLTKGQAKAYLTHFEKILEKRDWIIGYLTIADFWLFEQLELILTIDNTKLEPYPNLVKFYQKFLEIPQVKAHRESDKFFKTWFWPGANPTWNNNTEKN